MFGIYLSLLQFYNSVIYLLCPLKNLKYQVLLIKVEWFESKNEETGNRINNPKSGSLPSVQSLKLIDKYVSSKSPLLGIRSHFPWFIFTLLALSVQEVDRFCHCRGFTLSI
jgi:hypothetical protein